MATIGKRISIPASALVFGEALIDIVVERDSSREYPGGSPLNVAIGLSRLGIATTLATQFGDDHRGRALRSHLDAAGVQLDVVREATSTAEATIAQDGSAEYEFQIIWSRPPADVPVGVDIVHTGSLGAFLQPGAEAALEVLSAAPTNALRSLDPNIRPALMKSKDALPHLNEMVACADIVKMSEEDAAWLYPGLDINFVLDDLLTKGVCLAAITRGAHGATMASPVDRVNIPALPGAVQDTIGAGDSFMSGLLYAASLGGEREALKSGLLEVSGLRRLGYFAARCAGITVSRAGANPPSLGELEASD